MHRFRRSMFGLLIAAMSLAPVTSAHGDDDVKTKHPEGVWVDNKLGQQVPLDLVFRDEDGKTVRFGDFCDGIKKPVILSLVYFKCPNIQLCTLQLNDLNRGMNGMKTLSAGDDYQVVTVSFDPNEGPALARDKKDMYMQSYRRPHAEQGWRFLTGDAESIQKLTTAVGFHYRYDAKFGQYIHPSGLILLTPRGIVSRYFFGIDYDLKDLRLSLEEASNSKIGTFSDKFLLYCFHYDPTTSKYSLAVVHLMQIGGVLTMGAFGAFWFAMYRREHRPA